MNNGTKKLREEAAARYASVRHLSHAKAAAALGVTENAVRWYRKTYPDARNDNYGQRKAERPVYTPPRHDVRKVAVLNIAGSSTQVPQMMSVSLPREPWNPA